MKVLLFILLTGFISCSTINVGEEECFEEECETISRDYEPKGC